MRKVDRTPHRRFPRPGGLGAIAVAVVMIACAGVRAEAAPPLPQPAHVVVIVEENKTLAEIIGNESASYINQLARNGALFTDAHGIMHPSLPNYFAMFAGQTNTNGDDCPPAGILPNAPNLASELFAAHRTFAGYAEGLPHAGSTVCAAGSYARKHAPWVAFHNIPASASQPLHALPSYDNLPTVAFIIPNVDDDMHDGTVEEGDAWLREHLGKLIAWAHTHDTLVILTWDEGYDEHNSIPLVFFGPMVRAGRYSVAVNHDNVLRTLEDMYDLPPTGRAGKVAPITGCWK
jgi:hypothetical protein